MDWHRTKRHIEAEAKVRQAIDLISEARTVMTIWELERFIRDNITTLGYHGFINSIGTAMIDAATIEATRTVSAQKQTGTNETTVNETSA